MAAHPDSAGARRPHPTERRPGARGAAVIPEVRHLGTLSHGFDADGSVHAGYRSRADPARVRAPRRCRRPRPRRVASSRSPERSPVSESGSRRSPGGEASCTRASSKSSRRRRTGSIRRVPRSPTVAARVSGSTSTSRPSRPTSASIITDCARPVRMRPSRPGSGRRWRSARQVSGPRCTPRSRTVVPGFDATGHTDWFRSSHVSSPIRSSRS